MVSKKIMRGTLFLALFFSGCETFYSEPSSPIQPVVNVLHTQSSPNRPLWLDNPGDYSKARAFEKMKYFVGVATPTSTYAEGRKIARAEALRAASESIRSSVRTLYLAATKRDERKLYGINGGTVEQEFVDTIDIASSNNVTGLSAQEYFWEKETEETVDAPAVSTWNVSVLESIPDKDYKKDVYLAILRQEKKLAQDSVALPQAEKTRRQYLQQNPELAPELPPAISFFQGTPTFSPQQREIPPPPFFWAPGGFVPVAPVVKPPIPEQPQRFFPRQRLQDPFRR